MNIINFHNKSLNIDLKEIMENDYEVSKGPVSVNSIEILYDSSSVSYVYYNNVDERDFDFYHLIRLKRNLNS